MNYQYAGSMLLVQLCHVPQVYFEMTLVIVYLESQVAQNNRRLYPKVAHNSLKVAQNCRPGNKQKQALALDQAISC